MRLDLIRRPGPGVAALAVVLTPWAGLAQTAPASTLAVAPELRVGDVDTFLERAPLQPSAGQRDWTVTPSLGLQQTLTDNARVGGGRRGDLITSFDPAVQVVAATERITGSIRLAPQFEAYAFEAHQNTIALNLNGDMKAMVVEDTLYVSLGAYGTQQSTSGGNAPDGAVTLGRNDRTQTTNLTVSPYLTHRFGGFGTGSAGYSLEYTDQSGGSASVPGAADPYFTSQSVLTQQEFLDFQSGEDFGRLQDDLRVQGTQYAGSGVLDGAYRNTIRNELDYALDRHFKLLGSIGWEDIRYGGLPSVRIDDATWSAGLSVTPNADSLIRVQYAHANGFNSPSVDGAYAITARTVLTASYADTLGTSTSQLQDTLSSATTNSLGATVSRFSGAPLQVANQQFGLQDSLQRTKTYLFGCTLTLPRDTLALRFSGQTSAVRANSPGTAGFAQRGWSVSGTWTHDFTPVVSGLAFLQYGRTVSQLLGTGGGDSDTVTLDLSLSRQFARNLFANVHYVFTDRSGVGGAYTGGRGVQNALLLGLVRTF